MPIKRAKSESFDLNLNTHPGQSNDVQDAIDNMQHNEQWHHDHVRYEEPTLVLGHKENIHVRKIKRKYVDSPSSPFS